VLIALFGMMKGQRIDRIKSAKMIESIIMDVEFNFCNVKIGQKHKAQKKFEIKESI